MTREATNMTTATNYALEGEIRDQPSVPAIPGPAGSHGPWLELIPGRHTTIPSNLILTKTHCKGFCSGRNCGPEKSIQTTRSFLIGCLGGTQAVRDHENGDSLIKKDVTYDHSLVRKAIHIFRHPLDNIVARFHLEYYVQKTGGASGHNNWFPKNATGFRNWCAAEDLNRDLLDSRFIDRRLRQSLTTIPCFNDFYRYVQWHNLAFEVTRMLRIPTLLLHYNQYASNFTETRDLILRFLEMPRSGEGIKFQLGKEYRSYYSMEDKAAIRRFLYEFSSPETWEQLQGYDLD
jgi:hypothetical protein